MKTLEGENEINHKSQDKGSFMCIMHLMHLPHAPEIKAAAVKR